MSVNSFYCYNDFYQWKEHYNNFNLVFQTDLNDTYLIKKINLNIGNLNIYD